VGSSIHEAGGNKKMKTGIMKTVADIKYQLPHLLITVRNLLRGSQQFIAWLSASCLQIQAF
jgi:hypothetical protein